ncbi:MAG TPA: Na+/H+ antiporter NhaA, partial [Verrucomicrobiae bacterium]|nr:Na+/H+ antiporter NhaA [Verrucomicrobiae bacterium]
MRPASKARLLTHLFIDFCRSEQASGILLIVCTVASVIVANSGFSAAYLEFWHREIGFGLGGFSISHSLGHWINDGLMTVFFLLIGLEIERELYIGELSSPRDAALPALAAVGGMAMPALVYFLVNSGSGNLRGAGIPIATDIAFSLAILSLLGNRVPAFLKVFLAAMAIIDDLGAILVIALFYSKGIDVPSLLTAAGIFSFLLLLNRLRVPSLWPYLVAGVFMWYFMAASGVHPTISGVLLAFAIPFGSGDADSPSYRLQHFLHYPVAYLVMPLFALANTGIAVQSGLGEALVNGNGVGVAAGLLAGKPLGVVLAVTAAVRFGLGSLPEEVSWRDVAGIGFLAGIGFTMSIFITLLAFDDPKMIEGSKVAILLASLVAATVGFLCLRRERA